VTGGHDPPNTNNQTTSTDTLLAEIERLVVLDPTTAVFTATSAMDTIDREGNLDDRFRLRRFLALAYANTNQFEQALAVCDDAVQLPGAREAPIEVARIHLASMQPLAIVNRIDDAIRAGQTALHTLEANDRGSVAERIAVLNIGAIYAMTGRPGDALPYFDRARDHPGDEPVLLGQIETNRGTALAALDRFEEAEAAFGRAATLLNTDEMSWAAAIAEGNLADLAARQGAINRSLRHFEASRRHLERDGAYGDLGRLNAEEATVLATAGLTSLAREAFTDAIALLGEHGAPGDLAMAQVAYGAALFDAGELTEAGSLLARTSELIDAAEHPDLFRQFVALRAQLAIAAGEYDEAQSLIETGMRGVADRPLQRLRWSMMQADVTRARGHADEARAMFLAALAVAEAAQITPLVAELHRILADIARNAGESEQADTHARTAIGALEGIRGTIQADRLRQSWHHSRLGVYGDLYLSLLQRTDDSSQAEAFGVAERIRSRMLLDAMRAGASDVDEAGPVTDADLPLVEALGGHRRWLNWMYSALADGVEPSESQLRELQERERAASLLAGRLATLGPTSGFHAPLALERVQRDLDESTVILSYLEVDERLTVQVIAKAEIHGVPDIAPAPKIAELVASLQFQIGRVLVHGGVTMSTSRLARLRRDMDETLERLYDVLIAPIANLLSTHEYMIVVPSGVLHSVPFAALLHRGSYLIDRIAVMTAPGISVLAGMGGVDNAIGRFGAHPLVAGVPDALAPGLGEEAIFVGARFPCATVLVGEAASREAVLDAMPGSDLVHLACHGRFDATHPSASGLRMADGWLTLDQLTELRLDQALVVLTGCETGRVRVDQGDDRVGMMAAMIAAGASGLVTSLWKTHDAAATALMASFYDALDGGDDAVTALRQSQREVRQQFDHPAWWAPFVGVHTLKKGVSR
jgi:tetratricopeptide (TPR) repeat protein